MPASGEGVPAESLEALRERSSPWLDRSQLRCAFHKEALAVAACPSCGRLLCAACASASGSQGLCSSCRREMAKTSAFSLLKAVFFNPALWALLCIAIASGLYLLGVGNPSAEEMQKLDSHKSWNEQQAPKLYLAQAARERRRAAFLAEKPDDQAEAAKWHARAAVSFKKAAELWADAPAAFAPQLAAAEALSKAGSPKDALAEAMKAKPPQEAADLMDYSYALGQIALAAGDNALARKLFKEAYMKAQSAKSSPIDSLISAFSSDGKAANFALTVKILSGLNADPQTVMAKCRPYLDAKDLPQQDDDSFKPVYRRPPPARKQDGEDFQIEIVKPKGGAK